MSLELTQELAQTHALAAGFSDAAVVALPYANEARDAQRFTQWLQSGRAASMHYLERTGSDADKNALPLRERVSLPFPWARSALVCFASYHAPAQPLSTAPAPNDAAWIARYAWSSRVDSDGARRPSDYHKVLRKRLNALEAPLHEHFGPFEVRAFVDTGPIVERSVATAAGLGWTGKNTCLIHPQLGSFGFLAVLLTSLELQSPAVSIPDRCGSCRRCIEACPTQALTAPYQMDASRCIAYLTIEHRGPIAEEQMAGIGRQVFGCDICQDVCPWNNKAANSTLNLIADLALAPRSELINPTLDWLARLTEADFERNFNGSPVRRAGFHGLQRNIAIAMGNSGLSRFQALLQQWTAATDDGLRSAAQWALKRLQRCK